MIIPRYCSGSGGGGLFVLHSLDEVERAKRGEVKLKTEEEFLAELEAEATYNSKTIKAQN